MKKKKNQKNEERIKKKELKKKFKSSDVHEFGIFLSS